MPAKKIHGYDGTPTYHAWTSMRARCLNPNDKSYASCGGRGVTICDWWRESFENFLADMGERPTPAHSLLRIDKDGPYEAGNCEWVTRARAIKHGAAGTHPYWTWAAIKQRCLNPNNARYADYGGRGITICERWRDSFESFALDMGDRPTTKYTVDRIDNDGNYSCGRCQECIDNGWPMNCRWATRKEQVANRRQQKLHDMCHRGKGPHAMSGDNVYVRSNGKRECRACMEAAAERNAAIKRERGRERERQMMANARAKGWLP